MHKPPAPRASNKVLINTAVAAVIILVTIVLFFVYGSRAVPLLP